MKQKFKKEAQLLKKSLTEIKLKTNIKLWIIKTM